MKHDYRLSIIMILVVVFSVSSLFGQQPKQNYGKATDEIFPYQRYQKAYKYFFLESLNFYGAGRDKVAPKDLNEIRIGFLGPLEGSVIVSLGKQMLQGATLAIEEANKNGGYSGKPFKLMIHNDVGLWGALISLLAQSSLNKREIDLELAKKVLRNFVKSSSKEITIDTIQKMVCDYFDVPYDK